MAPSQGPSRKTCPPTEGSGPMKPVIFKALFWLFYLNHPIRYSLFLLSPLLIPSPLSQSAFFPFITSLEGIDVSSVKMNRTYRIKLVRSRTVYRDQKNGRYRLCVGSMKRQLLVPIEAWRERWSPRRNHMMRLFPKTLGLQLQARFRRAWI